MKPSFALNFTDDSVALLHRTKRGWLEVGRSAYDTPDLAEAMSYLRATALGLAPQGVTTKLVIPASQVRYFDIEAPGPTQDDRHAQIAAALDGRTAYAVDDLAFDWSGNGPTVRVAVVARETLAEAEAFALAHRFAPLAFVALPEDGTFGGEPWFGLTKHASGALAGGETVERDADAITILSRSLPRSAAVAPATPQIDPPAPAIPVNDPPPDPAPETPAPETPPEPEPAPDPVVEPDPIPDPAPRPLPDPVTEPEPVPEPLPVPEPVPATVPEPAPELPEPEPVEIPQPDVTPDPAPDLPPPAEMPAFDPVADPVTMTAPTAFDPAPEPDEAPIALDVEDEDLIEAQDLPPSAWPALAPLAQPRVMPTNVTENSLPPDDDTPATTGAFTSRRSPTLSGAALSGAALANTTAAAAQNMARRLGAASRSASRPASPPIAPTAPRIPKFGFPEQADPQPPRPPAPAVGKASLPDPLDPDARPIPPPELPPMPPLVAAPTAAPDRIPRPATAQVPRTPAARKSPRALTAPVKGKPRYLGLILTGLLLVALALAAAISSYYSASTNTADPSADPVATASNADPAAAVPTPNPAIPNPAIPSVAIPSVDDEMLADGQDPEALADPAGADLTTADLGVSPLATAQPEPATTGEAPAMQATVAGNDEIYLSATDAAPPSLDAAALPRPEARGDPAPNAPLPPPAFGTVYKFDANGLIVPTPQGITTPEGVLLVAGKPPVVPPARPAGLVPPASTPASTPASATPATNPDDQSQAFPADPALRGKRPAPRPDGFAAISAESAPAGTAATEDASLAPQADSRLAAIRPLPRPATLDPATLAPAANPSTLALVTPDGAISPLGGLALSPRPVARPSAIASAVEAAVAAAAIQPEPAAEPAPEPALLDDGNVTPETEQEPQLASAAPSIPTQANVAKEATDKNVLNLGKINLIGVYGSQSNRYALVRQPNGRIIKVSVGDRIDGGRVAAVTETELRYEKRGQMLVLAMPRG